MSIAPTPTRPNAQFAVRRTVLWFGNSGRAKQLGGMYNLEAARYELEKVFYHFPFTLKVVSDNQDLYEELIRPFSFPTTFKKWKLYSIGRQIHKADVVILPDSQTHFTLAKSPNRALFAVAKGTAVVATPTDSLLGFGDIIDLNGIETGLLKHFETTMQKDETRQAQKLEVVHRFCGKETISFSWAQVINKVVHDKKS